MLYFMRALLGPRSLCQFLPSCTDFAAQQIQTKSFFVAIVLIFKRLLSCHPFNRV